MKSNQHLGGVVTLIVSAALYASTPSLPAQAQDSAAPPQQAQQQDQQSKIYAGKIVKLQNGNYALVTGQTPQGQASGHFLDNQDEAKKYEGKEVRVTGTLELASNTIHVSKIEAAG
jgi:hypothetical protein